MIFEARNGAVTQQQTNREEDLHAALAQQLEAKRKRKEVINYHQIDIKPFN